MEVRQLEAAIWSVADGYGSDADLALLDADERASLFVLDRLVGEAEDDRDAVRRTLAGDERDQVVADFDETVASLRAIAARYRPVVATAFSATADDRAEADDDLEPEDVQLQAS